MKDLTFYRPVLEHIGHVKLCCAILEMLGKKLQLNNHKILNEF